MNSENHHFLSGHKRTNENLLSWFDTMGGLLHGPRYWAPLIKPKLAHVISKWNRKTELQKRKTQIEGKKKEREKHFRKRRLWFDLLCAECKISEITMLRSLTKLRCLAVQSRQVLSPPSSRRLLHHLPPPQSLHSASNFRISSPSFIFSWCPPHASQPSPSVSPSYTASELWKILKQHAFSI